MLILKIRALFSRLKRYRLFFCVSPLRIKGPAVILFPLESTYLCCGLAGIVTVKKVPPAGEDPLTKSFTLLEKIKGHSWEHVESSPYLSVHDYLNGKGYLEAIEKALLDLKRDDHFVELCEKREKTSLLKQFVEELKEFLTKEEEFLETKAGHYSTAVMERINSRLVALRDLLWTAEVDIGRSIEAMHGQVYIPEMPASPSVWKKLKKLHFLFNCLDRLEVRGRDSAGIQLIALCDEKTLWQFEKSLAEKGLQEEFDERRKDRDLVNGSLSVLPLPSGEGSYLSFTYKTSSVVGELGLNRQNLVSAIREDKIFHQFVPLETLTETFFIHTRWASVGSITEENCHPLNNFITGGSKRNFPHYGEGPWVIYAALNGDIDNYLELRREIEQEGELIAPSVTTDTKIIPLMVQKYLIEGYDLTQAFLRALNRFEGSHAIVLVSNVEPTKTYLALRGSGQSLYVGLAPDGYIFSSEVYGLVELTPHFYKLEGEKLLSGQAGQVVILNQDSSGGLTGMASFTYDGTPLTIGESQITKAQITTRDIDRGGYPHYFLKEIAESSHSVRKTLRGKYLIRDGKVQFNLSEEVMPERIKNDLREGKIKNIVVIGHGTAAVAGEAIAAAFERYLPGKSITCEAKIASELSGFGLLRELQQTLVIAVTQSGTTTDTNRAVTLARDYGASVLAIVNRRQSDITTKADGVFYTSDGRDVEMSVASTKAFYSQIIAGHLLALFVAQFLGTMDEEAIRKEIALLEETPLLMGKVFAGREAIRETARKTVRQKRYWAVVGSGPNKIAADEIRIKLSELCYRTISSDVVENKKHIDLSAEPLLVVCAAGTPEMVLEDIVKDVAIFKAHRACVVVITEEGEERFREIADAIIEVPKSCLPVSVILNTLAGHLFGYYAALCIDEEAKFFREFRGKLNVILSEQEKKNLTLYERMADRKLRYLTREFYGKFNERRQEGYFSLLNAKTMADLVLLLKYCAGQLPLDDFPQEFPREGNFLPPFTLLDITLGQAIDELSRPIDAIRHQAKTVTVGTSRKEPPLTGIIFDLLRELGYDSTSLTARNILTLTVLQQAIVSIAGYTLYEIGNLDSEGKPTPNSTIVIKKRGGISLSMKSRTETSQILMGTKRTLVSTGRVYAGYGKADGATLIIIPLLQERKVRNLLLVHVSFNDALPFVKVREILGVRYNDIQNMVNEYNLPWEDRYLTDLPLAFLLGEPTEVIARKIVATHGKLKE